MSSPSLESDARTTADPACLCDVDLSQYPVTPLLYPPASVMYSGLAGDLCMKEFDKITWEGWAGWLCAITDEAAKRKVSALVATLEEFRTLEAAEKRFSGDTRSALRKSYLSLLGGGYNTTQAAGILNTTPEALFELIVNQGGGAGLQALGVDGVILLEFMLQDGSLSLTEMATELSTKRSLVKAHADRMGITPPLGKKGKSMSPDVTACMQKCIAEGLSLRKVVAKVLEETGVKVSETHVARHRATAQAKP